MILHGPERLCGQGIDPNQFESANAAIAALLTSSIADQIDLVLTYRHGAPAIEAAYEVWSSRGMIRFQRLIDDDGVLRFQVIEQVGVNPVANQDQLALRTLAAECAAAEASGFDATDPNTRFIAPEHQSYPFAYERIAQLFDSPNAPDLVLSPRDWCTGLEQGTHGALHVRQARAPLWISGPGVVVGSHDIAARAIDIAPTCMAALGFPLIDGADATGRTSSQRGKTADVFLARQDGRVLQEVLDAATPRPLQLYVFVLDGLHHTELEDRLHRDPNALPNLRRLRDRAAVLNGGSIVNFPSITWPSHTSIATGTWGGHHDVVNPSYYLREIRDTVSPQGIQVGTETFANPAVESLYEAFHRMFPDCVTAAIHAPFGRGARHAVLEGRNLCDRNRLKDLSAEFAEDINPRWEQHRAVASEAILDTRGIAQVIELFSRTDQEPPRFVYHELALTDGAGHEYGPHGEGLADALTESDARVGRALQVLDQQGLFESTLFVVSADHGMAPQDVTLHANPAGHILNTDLSAIVAEPMIWLIDMSVVVERAADGRTGRVFVSDNDADPNGDHPPLAGVGVSVATRVFGQAPAQIAFGRTDANGLYGFATPSNLASDQITVTLHGEGRNTRHLGLDGTLIVTDLKALLYL